MREDEDNGRVEWVNGEDSDYPEGQYVEAVFVGHTHENHAFYAITPSNIDSAPYDKDSQSVTGLEILYSSSIYYIETDTATKRG